MRNGGLFLVVFAALLIASPAAGQIQGTIIDVPNVSPVDAFDVRDMGAYHPSVIYQADIFALYWHGGGPSDPNGDGNPSNSTWTWTPHICTTITPGVPAPGHPECNDRVMFGWKHLSCALGGACGTNHYWNIYPFTSNYPGMNYTSTMGGSTTGLRSMANWSTGNTFPNPYLPPTSHPEGTSYGGAGGPSVLYVNGRYFMAYDIAVGADYSCHPGLDTHRIGWGYSNDGVNWTYPGLLIRDASEEHNSGAGIISNQLYFENNTFYLVVTSLETSLPYLMRASYQSSPPYYSSWQLPTGVDASGNYVWGYTVPDFNVPGQPAGPVAFTPYTPQVDSCPSPTPIPGATLHPASASFQPLFTPAFTGDAYNPHVALAKVYPSNTASAFKYVYLVNITNGNYRTPDHNYPMRIATADSIEKPPPQDVYFDITAAQNTSHAQYPAGYGWQPMFGWLVPDSTYTRVYNPVTLYLLYTDVSGQTNNQLGRVQLKLTGGIYCHYTVTPSTTSFTSLGGSGTIGVTTDAVCGWSASTTSSFISLTGASGPGNGTVTMTISPNATGMDRTGTITVAEQMVTITQFGAPAPTNLVALTQSTTSVQASWQSSVQGPFELQRKTGGGAYQVISSNASSPFSDNQLTPNTAYVYKVRVAAGGDTSPFSNSALATTVAFTDDPIVPGTTVVKTVHLTELRQAVDIVRIAAGLPAGSYTDPMLTPGSTTIRAVHILDLRSQLSAALTQLGVALPTYTDPTLTAGTTIRKEHIAEVRAAVK